MIKEKWKLKNAEESNVSIYPSTPILFIFFTYI